MRWEPQEPLVWPLCTILMENRVTVLSCMHLKESSSQAHQHLRKTLRWGRVGGKDMADQRQYEVRDLGSNPISATS